MNKRVIVIWTLILMLLVAPLFLRVASADTSSYDTCVDVDGDNRFVASYAIEFDMDTGQEEDRFYDVCLSNSQVREYLCTGGTYDDHAYSVDYDCPTGYECNDGKCVVEGDEDFCHDTDAGFRPDEKGTVTAHYGGQDYEETDVCYDSNSVKEYHCVEGNQFTFTIAPCGADYHCASGRCIPEVTYPEHTCSDSDLNNPYAFGTVTEYDLDEGYPTGEWSDECSGTKVVEKICTGGELPQMQSITYTCASGYECEGGKCTWTGNSCEDSDGGDEPYIGGRVTLSDGTVIKDECDGPELEEYICLNGDVESVFYYENDLPEGYICATDAQGQGYWKYNGGNPGSCTETDNGIDYYNAGKVILADGTIRKDRCDDEDDSPEIVEMYCKDDGNLGFSHFDCPNGCATNNQGEAYCKNGNSGNESSYCIDSDGGRNPLEKGTVSSWDGDSWYNISDNCKNNKMLREGVCENGYPTMLLYNCKVAYNSSYSCKSGRCVNNGGVPIPQTYSGKWINTGGREITEYDTSESEMDHGQSIVGIKITKTVDEEDETGDEVKSSGSSGSDSSNLDGISGRATYKEDSTSPDDGGRDENPYTGNVRINIYELDTIDGIGDNFILGGLSTNGFFSILGRVVGNAVRGTMDTSRIITVERPVTSIDAEMVNNKVEAWWTLDKNEIIQATGNEDNYEFVFEMIYGDVEKEFYDKILNVNVDWGTPGGNSKVHKVWLDKDGETEITEKTMNWDDLDSSSNNLGGERGGLTGNVVLVGGTPANIEEGNDDIAEEGSNLVYMKAYNLSFGPGTVVYFNVYENDGASEGGVDDAIRTGNNAIAGVVGSDRSTRVPIYFKQDDIIKASQGDGRTAAGILDLEMYYTVSSGNSIGHVRTNDQGEVQEGILRLRIIFNNNGNDTNSTAFCVDSDGGENYFLKGTVTSSTDGNFTDFCIDSERLNEYFCIGNSVAIGAHACENGCSEGACISEGINETFCGDGFCDPDENATSCPEDCGSINNSEYLTNAQGVWKDAQMTHSINDFTYVRGEINMVSGVVKEINPSAVGKAIRFGVWERNDVGNNTSSDDSIINPDNEGDSSTRSDNLIRTFDTTVDSQGIAYFVWNITDEDISNAGIQPDNVYEFYFGVKMDGEQKIFYTNILHMKITSGGEEPYCGDGICNGDENPLTCPTDCVNEPVCGNGICEEGENEEVCPADCGSVLSDCIAGGNFCVNSCVGESLNFSCPESLVCCDSQNEETCSELGGGICSYGESCVGGTEVDASDLGTGETCCIGGSCQSGGNGGGGDDCSGVRYCADELTKEDCENPCPGVLENEIELSAIDCSDPDIDCGCVWADDVCSFAYNEKSSLENVGSCTYITGDVIENCYNTGTMIINYQAVWTWDPDNCFESEDSCLSNIGPGQGTSCIERTSGGETCWSVTNSDYNTCLDYQETMDCSAGSEGDLGSDGSGNGSSSTREWYQKPWFLILLAVIIILLILLIWFILYKRKEKVDEEKRLFGNKNNLYNLLNYIDNVKRRKMPDEEVRKSLRKSGWTPEQIRYAMKKYSKNKNSLKKK